MKQSNKGLKYALTLLSAIASLSCGNFLSPDESENLIPNPSFEIFGKPSIEHWAIQAPSYSVVQDAPPTGGEWSLEIAPYVPGLATARAFVVGQSGRNVYRLTGSMRSLG